MYTTQDRRLNNSQRNAGKSGSFNGNGQNNRKGNFRNGGSHPKIEIDKSKLIATAPYNFVELNDFIVTHPLNETVNKLDEKKVAEGYKKYLKEEGMFTGYFDVEVKNLTPMYIGGEDGIFTNGSDICIPGSSMRGCLKNVFKIITCSSFRPDEDVEDKRLYFRSFGNSRDPLAQYYKEIVFPNNVLQAKPGFLVKLKNADKYFICPINKKLEDLRQPNKGIDGKYEWDRNSVTVHTGWMNKKMSCYKFPIPNLNVAGNMLEVPQEVIKGYQGDKSRSKDALNILNDESKSNGYNSPEAKAVLPSKYDHAAPCFYILEKDKNGTWVASMGAGPYYRLPYKKTVANHIPSAVRDERGKRIDFTDAVFGRLESWSSRIFFDDLYLSSSPKKDKLAWHKILSSPKPTSFQLYLQPDGKKAVSWKDNSDIRGYKMYWHRKTEWQEKNAKKQNESVTSKIAPVSEGNRFVGRIRFENLSALELGAICHLFKLGREENICYKLGMGKPIGMGTVKLAAELHIQRDDYYKKLFDDKGFALCDEVKGIDTFTKVFDDYLEAVKKEWDKKGAYSRNLYDSRIEQLKAIMSIAYMEENKEKWEQATRYIEIPEGKSFDKPMSQQEREAKDKAIIKERLILPSIKDVVKGFRNK